MGQTLSLSDRRKGTIPIWHRPAVTPDDAVPQYPLITIHQHQSMHLVGNANSSYILRIIPSGSMRFPDSLLYMLPPHLRTLLRPTRLKRYDTGLRLGVLCRDKHF